MGRRLRAHYNDSVLRLIVDPHCSTHAPADECRVDLARPQDRATCQAAGAAHAPAARSTPNAERSTHLPTPRRVNREPGERISKGPKDTRMYEAAGPPVDNALRQHRRRQHRPHRVVDRRPPQPHAPDALLSHPPKPSTSTGRVGYEVWYPGDGRPCADHHGRVRAVPCVGLDRCTNTRERFPRPQAMPGGRRMRWCGGLWLWLW